MDTMLIGIYSFPSTSKSFVNVGTFSTAPRRKLPNATTTPYHLYGSYRRHLVGKVQLQRDVVKINYIMACVHAIFHQSKFEKRWRKIFV